MIDVCVILVHFCWMFKSTNNNSHMYLHDFIDCCWWQTLFTSFPIFTIMSLPTLLLQLDSESDSPSIDNSKANCRAADDDEVGDNSCCWCCCFGFFWPQTLNAFCAFVRSISENIIDILNKYTIYSVYTRFCSQCGLAVDELLIVVSFLLLVFLLLFLKLFIYFVCSCSMLVWILSPMIPLKDSNFYFIRFRVFYFVFFYFVCICLFSNWTGTNWIDFIEFFLSFFSIYLFCFVFMVVCDLSLAPFDF